MNFKHERGNKMDPEKLEISKELAQNILNYLVTQPYKDVAKLIAEIMQLQPILPIPKGIVPEKK